MSSWFVLERRGSIDASKRQREEEGQLLGRDEAREERRKEESKPSPKRKRVWPPTRDASQTTCRPKRPSSLTRRDPIGGRLVGRLRDGKRGGRGPSIHAREGKVLKSALPRKAALIDGKYRETSE